MEVETGSAKISYVIARGYQQSFVRFDNLRFGPKSTVTTASDGSYSLANLAPGSYRLLVGSNIPGFETTNTLDGTLDVALGNQTVVTHVDFGGVFTPSPWQNQMLPADVDASGDVNPLDVLALINDINQYQSRSLIGSPSGAPPYLDVNGDRSVSPLDVLMVINHLNSSRGSNGGSPGAEGERAAPPIIIDPVHGPTRPALASFAFDRSADAPTTWVIERMGSRLQPQLPENCGCDLCSSLQEINSIPATTSTAISTSGNTMDSLSSDSLSSSALPPALAPASLYRARAVDAYFAAIESPN